MSFSTKSAERFGTVIDRSPYMVEDPLVKIQYVSKGQNVVFGRTLKDENYSNLLYIGKILESTKGKSYLGSDAWLDTTFPHVIYITGTRGSGKSFDLGVLVEGISKMAKPSPIQNDVKPITSIIIDTQSQFWTLGYAPREAIEANKVQLDELKRWNLEANSLAAAKVYTPPGSTHISRYRTNAPNPAQGRAGGGMVCAAWPRGLQPARTYHRGHARSARRYGFRDRRYA